MGNRDNMGDKYIYNYIISGGCITKEKGLHGEFTWLKLLSLIILHSTYKNAHLNNNYLNQVLLHYITFGFYYGYYLLYIKLRKYYGKIYYITLGLKLRYRNITRIMPRVKGSCADYKARGKTQDLITNELNPGKFP